MPACERIDPYGDAFQTWRRVRLTRTKNATSERPAMHVTRQAFLSHNSKCGSPNLRRSGSPASCGQRKPGAGAPTWRFQVQKPRVNGMGGAFFIVGGPTTMLL